VGACSERVLSPATRWNELERERGENKGSADGRGTLQTMRPIASSAHRNLEWMSMQYARQAEFDPVFSPAPPSWQSWPRLHSSRARASSTSGVESHGGVCRDREHRRYDAMKDAGDAVVSVSRSLQSPSASSSACPLQPPRFRWIDSRQPHGERGLGGEGETRDDGRESRDTHLSETATGRRAVVS
jgi:hypothetical protein